MIDQYLDLRLSQPLPFSCAPVNLDCVRTDCSEAVGPFLLFFLFIFGDERWQSQPRFSDGLSLSTVQTQFRLFYQAINSGQVLILKTSNNWLYAATHFSLLLTLGRLERKGTHISKSSRSEGLTCGWISKAFKASNWSSTTPRQATRMTMMQTQ